MADNSDFILDKNKIKSIESGTKFHVENTPASADIAGDTLRHVDVITPDVSDNLPSDDTQPQPGEKKLDLEADLSTVENESEVEQPVSGEVTDVPEQTVCEPENISEAEDEAINTTEGNNTMTENKDTTKANNINANICIIDETSTSVVFEQTSDLTDSVNPETGKEKKSGYSDEKVKFKPVQIILMVIVSLAALWCIMFTVDHTLAANGASPVFCKETQKYSDNSVSYKGLGYKVQFRFDADKNLTQKCLPSWKTGPNDGRTDFAE